MRLALSSSLPSVSFSRREVDVYADIGPYCMFARKEKVRDADQDRMSREQESNQDSYSPRSFTSGCCSLGDCDDTQTTGVCIFILAGDIRCVSRLMAHFPHAGLFFVLCAARGISQTSRGIKWWEWEDEREHCLLFSSLGTRAEQVVWGYLLSLTTSNTASGPPLLLWYSWELCCAEELEYLQHIPQCQMALLVHYNYQSYT